MNEVWSLVSSSASCRGSCGSTDLLQTGRIISLLNPTHLLCQLLVNRTQTDSFSVYQTMEKQWFTPERGRRFQKDHKALTLTTAGRALRDREWVSAAEATNHWVQVLVPSHGWTAAPSSYKQPKQFEKQWILEIQCIGEWLRHFAIASKAGLDSQFSPPWADQSKNRTSSRTEAIQIPLIYPVLSYFYLKSTPALGRCENLQVTRPCVFTVLLGAVMAIIVIHWECLQPSADLTLTLLPNWCDVLVL